MLPFHYSFQFNFVLFEQVLGLFFQGKGLLIVQELFGWPFMEPLPGEWAAFFVRLDLSLEQADMVAVPFSQNATSENDLLANHFPS